jgi:methionine synthase / methylenetetrahydrofolate reductase(NADPH)
MRAFSDIFGDRPVLADGGMGTMIISRGISISRCFAELNVSDPALILSIHKDYLQAGAEILETNTFGANRFQLARHGLADKVAEFNAAGVRIARQAADGMKQKQAGDAWVAGTVGPLGVPLEPLGKTGLEEARAAFEEQIRALVAAGVDMIIIETMMALNQAREAVLAARAAAPDHPVLVMMTVDDDSNCLDGASPAHAAAVLTEAGADAVGVNCSSGPATVLTAIEGMRAATSLPIAAMPNAGLPRAVEGRNMYFCSPEYMASFARKALAAGAQILGGCCGTTPHHIRAMRAAVRAFEGEMHIGEAGAVIEISSETPPLKIGERSRFGALLDKGTFITLVEMMPPRGIDCSRELEGAQMLASRGVHAISVMDSLRATARISAQSLCIQIRQHTGVETVVHYTCRDRNLLSIQSDLLGAASLGLRNVLCMTGAPPKQGNYPDATAVFDVDSIGLVNVLRLLNHGLDIGANPFGASTNFTIGVTANPGAPDIENELRRLRFKVEAGAEYVITQPVFDLTLLEQFIRRIEFYRIPVIAGIWPLTNLRNAEFMKNDLRVSVPEWIMLRMAQTDTPEAAQREGVRIAQEMLEAVRPYVQGVQLSLPRNQYAAAAEVIASVLPQTAS